MYEQLGIDWSGSKSAPASVTYVKGGTSVDTWIQASNKYKKIRGARPGTRFELPTGAIGYQLWVAKTTCGDVAAAYKGWAGDLAKRVINEGGFGSILDPYAHALLDLSTQAPAICETHDSEYPANDQFWVLTKRLAIELDSRKAVPSMWTLVTESTAEALRDLKETGEGWISVIGKKLLVPAAMIGGAYLMLRKD